MRAEKIRAAYSEQWLQQVKESNRRRMEQAEHDRALAILRRRFVPAWAVNILVEKAKEHGVGLMSIVGTERFRPVVIARNDAIYAIKAAKPVLSSTIIAAWFLRDHTSILYSLSSHALENNLPALCGYNIEKVRATSRYRRAKQQGEARGMTSPTLIAQDNGGE